MALPGAAGWTGKGDVTSTGWRFRPSTEGASGVVRFEREAGAVLDDIIASRLEHHMALAYGDHRAMLRGVAGAMGLPLLEL